VDAFVTYFVLLHSLIVIGLLKSWSRRRVVNGGPKPWSRSGVAIAQKKPMLSSALRFHAKNICRSETLQQSEVAYRKPPVGTEINYTLWRWSKI